MKTRIQDLEQTPLPPATFELRVKSVNAYYAFGMLAEGMSGSSEGYRYGFNGKEMDNEISGTGNQYDYGFRIYNPRLGKFLSVDPLTRSYPELTPYQFASNTPIQAIDLDGLEAVKITQGWNPYAPIAANDIIVSEAVGVSSLLSASKTSNASEILTATAGNILKGTAASLTNRYQLEPKRGYTVAGIRDSKAGRIKNGKAVGDWVIRFDKPHAGAEFPHVNINPKATGLLDPHIPISSTTLKISEGAGSLLSGTQKIAVPIGVALDGLNIAVAYDADGGQIGSNTIHAAGEVVGGWAGAWLGAKGGAALGAQIGTLVEPGGGTAVGGIVGGVVGAIVGGLGGSVIGGESADRILNSREENGSTENERAIWEFNKAMDDAGVEYVP